jgi:hypothetical protein
VSVASALLFLGVVCLLAIAVAQFVVVEPTGRAMEAAVDTPGEEGSGTLFAGVLYGGGGSLNVLFAIALAVLAGLDLAGKRAARVMTWIVAPLTVLCCGCGSAIYSNLIFNSTMAGSSTGNTDLTAEQVQALGDALPPWFTPTVLLLVAVLLMCVIGTTIALALPASNEYFRKRTEVWIPPTGWPGAAPGGYPGAGAYPGGYPAGYPGYPGYPDYPAGYPGGHPGTGPQGVPPVPPPWPYGQPPPPDTEQPGGEQRPPQWPTS